MKTLKRTDGQIVEPLTRRERQIAEYVARGLRNKQIAAECGISAETVKRHLASIYAKLATSGRVALAIHVIQARNEIEMLHDTDCGRLSSPPSVSPSSSADLQMLRR